MLKEPNTGHSAVVLDRGEGGQSLVQDLRDCLEFIFGYKGVKNVDVWRPAFKVFVVRPSRRLDRGVELCGSIGKESKS